MSEQWERTIQCKDLAGRERSLRLLKSVDGASLVVQAPAGESAVLDLNSVNTLQTALSEFAVDVYRMGGQP